MWFTNVIKPTHRCNLGCSYCFNEDTRNPVMPEHILESTIFQTFEYAASLSDSTPVDFIQHRGIVSFNNQAVNSFELTLNLYPDKTLFILKKLSQHSNLVQAKSHFQLNFII